MRIAFVQQPIGHLLLPDGDRPLRSNSTGIWTYEMAVRCAAAHQVSVFGLSPEPHDVSKDHRQVRFHALACGLDHWRLKLAAKARKVAKRLGRRPDPARPYFLSSLYFVQYALRAALAARNEQAGVVHLANFPQFVPVFRRLNPHARLILHMHCDWLRQLDAATLRRCLDDCDLISGCSRYIVDGVRERFPEQAGKCFHLHNGVDTEFFRPPPEPPAGLPELLFIGRISPEKGVHVLLQAFIRVAERIPGIRLSLVGPQRSAPPEYITEVDPDPLVRKLARFYSSDPSAYFQGLTTRVPSPLADRVTFVPFCPQAELLPLYQRAALFVAPSVWKEPFGMPAAEAMACGIPVIASRTGGLAEIVADGNTGLLVEPENEEALATAIVDLLQDPARRRAMGEAGHRRVLEFFTWDRLAAQLKGFFGSSPGAIPAHEIPAPRDGSC